MNKGVVSCDIDDYMREKKKKKIFLKINVNDENDTFLFNCKKKVKERIT